ncbi:Cuticle protein 6, partial [Habropoda laboriosa]
LLAVSLASVGYALPTAEVLAYQDSLGQYSFGYSAPSSARSEVRTLNGETRGAYSYIDDAGVIQTAHYTADGENGFRVAATNLPVAPLPEVQDVIVAILPEKEEILKTNNLGRNNVFLKGLVPIESDTMELEKDVQLKEKLEESMKSENLSETMKMSEEGILEGRAMKMSEEGILEGETMKMSEEGILGGETMKMSEEGILGGETMKMSEEGILEGEMMKMASEAQLQEKSSESAAAESPKVSSTEMPLKVLKQLQIPIYRISQGNLAIDPSTIQGPINIEGSSLTPASTTLKLDQATSRLSTNENISVKELPVPKEKPEKPQEQQKLSDKEIIAPLNILPLSTPTLLKYTHVPTLHYFVYNH